MITTTIILRLVRAFLRNILFAKIPIIVEEVVMEITVIGILTVQFLAAFMMIMILLHNKCAANAEGATKAHKSIITKIVVTVWTKLIILGALLR